MSNDRNRAATEAAKNTMPAADILKLAAWIAGIVLMAFLLWSLTSQAVNGSFAGALNRVLEQSGDPRRVEPLPGKTDSKGFPGVSYWFSFEGTAAEEGVSGESAAGGSKVIVFPLNAGGTFFPCAAVVNGKKVEEFIPLNDFGKRMIGQVSTGILSIYTRRIEEGEQ